MYSSGENETYIYYYSTKNSSLASQALSHNVLLLFVCLRLYTKREIWYYHTTTNDTSEKEVNKISTNKTILNLRNLLVFPSSATKFHVQFLSSFAYNDRAVLWYKLHSVVNLTTTTICFKIVSSIFACKSNYFRFPFLSQRVFTSRSNASFYDTSTEY